MTEYKAGDLVSHPKYGVGIVDGENGRHVYFANRVVSTSRVAGSLTPMLAVDPAKVVVLSHEGNPEGTRIKAEHLRYYADRLQAGGWPSSAKSLDWMADQIEAQTAPSRPEEPTDPAVRAVVDGEEEWAKRRDGKWGCLDGRFAYQPTTWDHLLTLGTVEVVQP